MPSCPKCGIANPAYGRSNDGTGTRHMPGKKIAFIAIISIAGALVAVFLVMAGMTGGSITLPETSGVSQNPQSNSNNVTGVSSSTGATHKLSSAKLDELKTYALDKINQDRTKYGLAPVKLSSNEAAQIHAEELLQTRQLSHWTTDGMKPYMRYSVFNGTGAVAQNAASQFAIGVTRIGDFHLDACELNDFFCITAVAKQAIDSSEDGMMNHDKECCNDGHRLNILDKQHTHVSIGVAFNDNDFAMVQNFENQYITWSEPLTYDKITNTVSMKEQFIDSAKLDFIGVAYDPLPTPETYKENLAQHSYSMGENAAVVVPPAPPGRSYVQKDNTTLIEASKWTVEGSSFDISFSLDAATAKYGNGVYTILTWCDNGQPMLTTTYSVFRR